MKSSTWPRRVAFAGGVSAPGAWADTLTGLTSYYLCQLSHLLLVLVALVVAATNVHASVVLLVPHMVLAFVLPFTIGMFARQPPVGRGAQIASRARLLAVAAIVVAFTMGVAIGSVYAGLFFSDFNARQLISSISRLGIALTGTLAFYAVLGLTMTRAFEAVACAIGEHKLAAEASLLAKVTLAVIVALVGFALLQTSPTQHALGWATPIPFFVFACTWHMSLARQLRDRLREHMAASGRELVAVGSGPGRRSGDGLVETA